MEDTPRLPPEDLHQTEPRIKEHFLRVDVTDEETEAVGPVLASHSLLPRAKAAGVHSLVEPREGKEAGPKNDREPVALLMYATTRIGPST